jgi:hypothetical protein
MKAKRPTRWFVRFLGFLLAVSFLISLLLTGEFVMRWVRPDLVPSNQLRSIPDPFIGWRFLPNQQIDGKDEHGLPRKVLTNSLGFADDDHDVEKASNTIRIAFLGDSFTAAVGVDRSQNFTAIVGEELQKQEPSKKIEVLNFGQPSFGTGNEYLTWKHYVPTLSSSAFS